MNESCHMMQAVRAHAESEKVTRQVTQGCVISRNEESFLK